MGFSEIIDGKNKYRIAYSTIFFCKSLYLLMLRNSLRELLNIKNYNCYLLISQSLKNGEKIYAL